MILLRLITARQQESALDPDAQAFITAAGITNPTEENAINQLVIDLKGYSLWTKMTVLYPFVGGTSSSNSYNLKDTTQYQITWNGTVTHNSNGITGDGSSGYGDTGLAPNAFGSQNDVHVSIYSRTDVNETKFDFYSDNSGQTESLGLTIRFSGTFYIRANTDTYSNVSNADSLGHYIGTRTGASATKGYKNGSVAITGTTSSTSPNSLNLYICCRNNNGTADLFTTRNYAFASAGTGLSDTDASNLYTAVQAFQTTLGRQV